MALDEIDGYSMSTYFWSFHNLYDIFDHFDTFIDNFNHLDNPLLK